MKIIDGLIIITGIAIFIKYILYRRQIRDICRQLQFLQEHLTNKRIQTTLDSPEILLLVSQLNELYDSQDSFRAGLQKKDRRMKEMLANVSHDIRTPLTALKGYFQLLLTEDDPQKKNRHAVVISDKLEELTGLLDELFTYTKLQNEEYELELETADFTAIVLETLFSMYEMCKTHGMRPQLDIWEEPCPVRCNPLAVKRVIENIIRNAVLHGAGEVEISYYIEETRVCFTCKNTLESPQSVDMTQIFERFYKADLARSRQSTGLGLSIAKGFVEKMGGGIQAEIEDGKFVVRVYMERFLLTG